MNTDPRSKIEASCVEESIMGREAELDFYRNVSAEVDDQPTTKVRSSSSALTTVKLHR